jgi:hypothetical protein
LISVALGSVLEETYDAILIFYKLSRGTPRALVVANSDDDDNNDGDGAQTFRESCHLTLITGVVQPTFIYDWNCDLLSGNSAIVWSPRGRFGVVVGKLTKKNSLCESYAIIHNTWTRPMY